MSVFVIEYAHRSCSVVEVESVFGSMLNIAVSEVTMTVERDNRTGRPFKKFVVKTFPGERSAAYLEAYIEERGFVKLVYNAPYYWKIILLKEV